MYQNAFEIKHYFTLKSRLINYLNTSDKRDAIMRYLIAEYPKYFITKRKAEKIKCPLDIVFYLEKHNLVTVKDVSIFRQIADLLEIPDLIIMVAKHESCIAASTLRNLTYWDNLPPPKDDVQQNAQMPDKKTKIYEIVSIEIGTNWRELARNLSLREGEIDVLNDKHPYDLKSKIRSLLDVFINKEPEKWSIKLAHALRKTRRVDLQNKVLEIMSKNGTLGV